MLQIPLAFKGPSNLLSTLFSQDMVFKAIKLILSENIVHWQYDELLESVNAMIEDGKSLYKINLNWPIDTEFSLGTCQCQNQKPCIHLCSLVILSKAKLDKLAPFTGQLQANRNIQQTLATWLNQQSYDPFPNMARHRLMYILDTDTDEKIFTISMYKGYISKEGRYSSKAQLDSSVLIQKPLPKFVSLTDKIILNRMHKSGIINQHQFELMPNRDGQLIRKILQSGRCFWKNCYRPALRFDEVIQISMKMINIIDSVYISIYENLVAFKVDKIQHTKVIKIDTSKKITPHLSIQSHEINIPLDIDRIENIDVGKIYFSQGKNPFTFNDLSTGKVSASVELVETLAGFMRQIEKLDSLFSHYETAILDNYHINDRYLGGDFSQHVTLLAALMQENWQIEISHNFRLNQIKSNNWYADLKADDESDWFDLELGITIDGKSINILPYLVNAIKTQKWHKDSHEDFVFKLDDGTNVGVENESIKQILSTLTELYDDKSLASNEKLRLSKTQTIRLEHLQKSLKKQNKQTIQWQGDTWLHEKAKKLTGINGLEQVKAPDNLQVTLRDYQLTGLSWLQFLTKHHLAGILADDMGLGKTLQVLAHILTEKNNGKLMFPCLIVVPTSLLSNWQAEIKRFTPDLSSILLVGNKRSTIYENINNFDIVITSYGIMSRDVVFLQDLKFHLLILDEAQTIKNAKTRAAKSAAMIPSTHRLCLSGTPIENHLGELWSLFNFLMPGFLGRIKQFEHVYQFPIEKEKNQERQTDLSRRVSPFMLRRTKDEVAKELPAKTQIVQIIELDEAQANVYETIRLTMSNEIKKAYKKSNNSNNNFIIGNALLRLRQVCCHPALLNLDAINIENNESAKLNWLSTVLPNMIEEGRRILLFSSFTKMLDIIAEHLKMMNIDSMMLTGQTPASKRGGLIQKFQTGKVPVFLISLKAGGAGINLTAADTVIHFDPWWNPAAESQASDRAHRIGQDKNVFVYKLITKGTVEQRIQKMQKHKDALAQGIFDGQGKITSVLNDNQWQEFFNPIS